jgi:hypothetical protein
MELKDLMGKHFLSGVSMSKTRFKQEWDEEEFEDEDSNVMSFILDGVVYSAIEDPSDGYRSTMRDLKINEYQVENTFEPIQVMCKMRDDRNYNSNNTLELYDIENGKLILAAGTDNTDDYYPCFVSEWIPENLSISQHR